MPNQEETKEQITGKNRDKQGRFVQGVSGNPNGRKSETSEQKAINKVKKEFVKDYREKLTKALPMISPVLITLALEGNILAIKEINNRVMGQSVKPIDITTGGLPLIKPTPAEQEKINKAFKE